MVEADRSMVEAHESPRAAILDDLRTWGCSSTTVLLKDNYGSLRIMEHC